MTDELDVILLSDETLTPTPGFAASVMRAVRKSRSATAAIRFPWFCFAASLAAGLLCVLLPAAVMVGEKDNVLGPAGLVERITGVLLENADISLWAVPAAFGSMILVRLSVAFRSE